MSHNGHVEEIRNPGPYQAPASMMLLFLVMIALGVAAFAVGLVTNPVRAWAAFILNHFYFMSIATIAMFFAAIQWLTNSMWSAPVRRLMEASASYMPVAIITTFILYFGIHHLYIWSHPSIVNSDMLLKYKAGYFKPLWFFGRNIGFLVILTLVGFKMIKNSNEQDKDKKFVWTLRNKVMAPGFIVLFALGYTLFSWDQMMSLDAHWYSTMFGVYCFAGGFYAFLALTCLMSMHFRARQLNGIINDNHIHDLAKFMFGMVVFWAYIGFAQFMLIWYANLTEETGYFLHRMHGGWFYVSVFLALGKFALPFFLLLPRDAKRSVRMLTFVGIFMMVAEWIDLMWVVQPNFFVNGPVFGLIEIGETIGFIGLFGLVVTRFLTTHNLVAIGDPRLTEAVYHHHQ